MSSSKRPYGLTCFPEERGQDAAISASESSRPVRLRQKSLALFHCSMVLRPSLIVDLTAEVFAAKVAAQEDSFDRLAEFGEGLVGRMLNVAADEAP